MLVRAEGRFPYRGPQIATLPEIDGDLFHRLRTIWRCRNDDPLIVTAIGQRLALVYESGSVLFLIGRCKMFIKQLLT